MNYLVFLVSIFTMATVQKYQGLFVLEWCLK